MKLVICHCANLLIKSQQLKILLIIVATALILSGCSYTRPQPNSQTNDQADQKNKATDYTTSYLPASWIIEDSFFFSPEMYDAREGGPYSLNITLNNEFSTIDDYLKSKNGCIEAKTELNLNNNPAVQFTDSCAYSNPKVTLIEVSGNLVEAFSYSVSDEASEIKKILSSLKLTE